MKSCQSTIYTDSEGVEHQVVYPETAFKQAELIGMFRKQLMPPAAQATKEEFSTLFNSVPEEPILGQKQRVDRSLCFEKKTVYGKPTKRAVKPSKTFPKNAAFRKPEPKDDFFDTFKGKADRGAVETFKASRKIRFSAGPKVEIESVGTLFMDAEEAVFKVTKEGEERFKERFCPNAQERVVDFREVYKFNKALGISKNNPLWYIFHPDFGNSFGPISSKQLEKLHKNSQVKSFYFVRPIDLFTCNLTEPVFFFKLGSIESEQMVLRLALTSRAQKKELKKPEKKKETSLYDDVKIKKKKRKPKTLNLDFNYEERSNPYDYQN